MASFPAYKHSNSSLDQYLREIRKYPLLNRDQEREYSARALQGDELAVDRLVQSNLRFVVSVAKKYQNQGVDLGDLIAVGNKGLYTAAKKYDAQHNRNVKFISYAVWWVRQAILQELGEQSRDVRVPLNQVSSIRKLQNIIADYKAKHPRMSEETILEKAAEELNVSRDTIDSLRMLQKSSLSFDAPVSNGEDSSRLSDVYAGDEPARAPDADLYDTDLSHMIYDALDELKPREALIVRLYYGLEDGREHTLEEIGQKLGVTRERIRQIRNKAFERLRSPRFKHLEQLLD